VFDWTAGVGAELMVSMSTDAVTAAAPVELPDGTWRCLEELAPHGREQRVCEQVAVRYICTARYV